MTDTPPLPLRPLLFVPLWFAAFIATPLVGEATFPVGRPLAFACETLGLGAQVVWTWRAIQVSAARLAATGRSDAGQRALRSGRRALGACILGFVFAMTYALVRDPTHGAAGSPIFEAPAVIVTLGGFVMLNATASGALCRATALNDRPSEPAQVGTFFQFLYLPLAAPFLYRRLKALRAADAQTTSSPPAHSAERERAG